MFFSLSLSNIFVTPAVSASVFHLLFSLLCSTLSWQFFPSSTSPRPSHSGESKQEMGVTRYPSLEFSRGLSRLSVLSTFARASASVTRFILLFILFFTIFPIFFLVHSHLRIHAAVEAASKQAAPCSCSQSVSGWVGGFGASFFLGSGCGWVVLSDAGGHGLNFKTVGRTFFSLETKQSLRFPGIHHGPIYSHWFYFNFIKMMWQNLIGCHCERDSQGRRIKSL